MSDNFVSLISYLHAGELQILEKQLNWNKIKYIVIKHGASASYVQSNYYEIKVAQSDYSSAKGISNKFKVSQFIESRKCPKCGSMLYELITELSFFQKILYMGTTPVRCRKCKTKFVI